MHSPGFGKGDVVALDVHVDKSVGIARGFLLAAIHNAGLASLTHTPSPMNFLCRILKRPVNEVPYLLIAVGYPTEGAVVPDIQTKVSRSDPGLQHLRVNGM